MPQNDLIVLSFLIGGFSFMFCFFTLWFFFKDTHNFAIFFKSRKRALNSFLIPFSVITPERSWSGWIYECTIGWLVSKPPLFPIEPVVTSRTWGEYFTSIFYGQKTSKLIEVVEIIDRPIISSGITRANLAQTETVLNNYLSFQKFISRNIWSNITRSEEVILYSKNLLSRLDSVMNGGSLFVEGVMFEPLGGFFGPHMLNLEFFVKNTRQAIQKNFVLTERFKSHPLIDSELTSLALELRLKSNCFNEVRVEFDELIKQTSIHYEKLSSCLRSLHDIRNSPHLYIDEDTWLWNETKFMLISKEALRHKTALKECIEFWEVSYAKNSSNLEEFLSLIRSLSSKTRYIRDALVTAPEIAEVAAFEIPLYDDTLFWSFIGKGALVLVALTASFFFFQNLPFKGINSVLQGVDLNFFSNNLSNRAVLLQSANEKVVVCHFQMITIIFLFFFILIPFFKLFLENKNRYIFFYYTRSVFDSLNLFRFKIKKYF